MHYLNETHIFIFLAQLFVLLSLAKGLGELFRRRGQPALTAELLVGVLLGPTILGRFWPEFHGALFPPDQVQQAMLETVAWIGVLFFLLTSGMEVDFSVAWRQRGKTLTIALADIVIPMVIAFVPCLLLPDRYLADPGQRVVFALFMATVMTISALPVAARVLHDIKLLKADVGLLIMSALTVNDIIGWILFTIVLGLFTQAAVQFGVVLFVFAGTVGFAAVALAVGPRITADMLTALRRRGLPEPATSLTFACLLGLLFGAFTQKLGIHALFGFFVAGVVMGGARNLSEQTRTILSEMVHAIFVPLFFVNIGLKIDFAASFEPLLVLFLCVLGVGGRYVGAWIGVSLSRVPRANRHLISIAHTPGGMMEVVVAVLAMENGLITEPIFVAIVFSAVFSSMAMGPWMRAALRRVAVARLANSLSAEVVVPDLAAADRAGAIRRLAGLAAAQAGVPGPDIADAALAREAEFGTALGQGVAIPHVRLDGLNRPFAAVGRSPRGLEWNAPDGQPVHRVFFVLSPLGVNDVHVQLLAEIATAMQKPENQRAFDEAEASALWRVLDEIFRGAGAGRRLNGG
jgi:Kef-type K+ transport system membrane component KefB/mannitol/fructose-specific phosphotransferase system IIA component (Ntr-type)